MRPPLQIACNSVNSIATSSIGSCLANMIHSPGQNIDNVPSILVNIDASLSYKILALSKDKVQFIWIAYAIFTWH